MKREPERFGWTAPSAPTIPALPKVPMELDFLVKSDTCAESGEVDPVGAFVKAAELQQQTKRATTSASDFDVQKAILAPDVRDREPVITTLRKDVNIPDWSWSAPVSISDDTPLEKRAHGTARERFRQQLRAFFGADHPEEYAEACDIAADCLAEELAAVGTDAA